MRIGYSTWGMPTLPIDTALNHLAALGFDGVELTVIPGFSTELDTLDSAERRRIRRLLNEHGLGLPAVAAHQLLLATEEDVHAENWRRLTASADLCTDLASTDGVPVLNTTLGSILTNGIRSANSSLNEWVHLWITAAHARLFLPLNRMSSMD